jgi:hypothetical protein
MNVPEDYSAFVKTHNLLVTLLLETQPESTNGVNINFVSGHQNKVLSKRVK